MSSRPDWFTPAAGAVGETGDFLAEANKVASAPSVNFEIESKDGQEMAHLHMGMDDLKKIMGKLQNQEAILTHYTDEMARREQQTRAHPIANLLSNVAGAMAQDPKMPGWVHALGKTSQALNPTADALGQQKMSVQGGIAEILKQEAGLTGAQLGVEREMRLTEASKARDTVTAKQLDEKKRQTLVTLQRDLSGKAAEGKYPGDAEQMLTLYGADPELAHSIDQYLKGENQKALDLQKAKDAAVTDKDKRDIQGRINLQTQKQSGDMAKLVKQHENALDLQDKKITGTTSKLGAVGGAKPLPEITRKQMASLDSAAHALDEVEKIFNEESGSLGIVGGITGRVREMTDKEFAGKVNSIRIQVANAIKATGAGARGFGPQERGFFQSISEQPFGKTVEQNLGVVKAWRAYIQRELSAIMSSHPEIKDWGEYTKILHPDAKDASPKPSGRVIKTDYGEVTIQEK